MIMAVAGPASLNLETGADSPHAENRWLAARVALSGILLIRMATIEKIDQQDRGQFGSFHLDEMPDFLDDD